MPDPITETVQTDSVPSQPFSLASLSPEERVTWRNTGEIPKPKSADSAPPVEKQEAVEAESAPATEATGSEPAKDLQETPRQKTKADTERRFQELLEELKETRRELAEARTKPAVSEKPASQPEAKSTTPAKPKIEDKDDKGEFKYKTLEEFNDARDEWLRQEVRREVEETTAKSAKEREQQEAQKVVSQRVAERMEKARAKHEDFDAVALNNDLPIKIGTPVDLFLVDSEQGAEVLYYLGQNPEELERIQGKATTTKDAKGNVQFTFNGGLHPLAQVRELTKLEMQLSEPKENPAPPKTRAPKPPSEVGGRGTQPADTVGAAVRANDFRAFKAEANRRALATAK